MNDREHDLAIAKQAEALNISRGSVYYLPGPEPESDLAIMRRLDRLHLEFPFAGSRMLRGLLSAEGCKIGRRLSAGLESTYQWCTSRFGLDGVVRAATLSASRDGFEFRRPPA